MYLWFFFLFKMASEEIITLFTKHLTKKGEQHLS